MATVTEVPRQNLIDNFRSVDSSGLSLPLSLSVENERRFFLPTKQLRDIKHSQSILITQSYFNPEIGAVVLALAAQVDYGVQEKISGKIKQTRIRESIDENSGETKYELALKLGQSNYRPTAKDELTIDLQAETYLRLLMHADCGTVVKRRLIVPANVIYTSSSVFQLLPYANGLKLEIDTPIKRKSGQAIQDLSKLGYSFAEIEIDNMELDLAMRHGEISFDIIDNALDVSADRKQTDSLRKHLSWHRLAREGFDKKASEALKALFKMHKKFS